MPWTGSIYRKGNYSTNGWTGDAANSIGIEAGRHDTQDNDFQDGISACINKNGANTPTVNLPMGGYKHTGAAVATANGEYLTYDQVNDGSPLKVDFANDRVGIGTTSPGTQLHVSSAVDAKVRIESTGGAAYDQSVHFKDTTSDWYIGNRYTAPADSFGIGRTATKDDFIITSSGQTIISTNAAGNYACSISNSNTGGNAYGLIIDGARNDYAFAVRDNNNNYRHVLNANGSCGIGAASGYNAAIQVDSSGNASITTANTQRFAVSTAGRKDFLNGYTYFAASGITSGAGTNALKYNTNDGLVTWDASSQLVKENIVDCPYGLNAVVALQPRKYFRTDDQKEEIGFVADELVNVLPEMVSFAEKSRFTKNDEDTELIPSSVAYDRLTSVLCKAIQELNAKVDALEARVAALEAV